MIDVALSGVLSELLPSRPAFGGYDTPGHHKSYKCVTIITSTKDKRSEEPAAVQEVIEMFYFNGDEVQAPVLTKNERELVRKLKDEWFGDGNNCDMISTDYEDSISTLGYTIAQRRSSGGTVGLLVVSLHRFVRSMSLQSPRALVRRSRRTSLMGFVSSLSSVVSPARNCGSIVMPLRSCWVSESNL